MVENKKFIFTFGPEGHPYPGGWVEVLAPNEEIARSIFRAIYPDRYDGEFRCSMVYSEEEFQRTKMFHNGNFGKRNNQSIILCIVNHDADTNERKD